MVSSITFGPDEQFRPITSTGHSSSARVKSSVDVPSRRRAVVLDADLRDDRRCRRPAASRAAKIASRISFSVAKRFEHQQVDAGFDQRFDLLAKNGARFFETGGAQRFQADAQRSDGARDKRLIASRFAGDAHAGLIDQPDLFARIRMPPGACDSRRRCWFRGSRRRP